MKTGNLNTHAIEIDGLLGLSGTLHKQPIIARFTSDEKGETLSLDVSGEIMIIVPYEPVKGLIEQARNAAKFGGNKQ
jgi:hypothetical protein